jgi:MFS family permease
MAQSAGWTVGRRPICLPAASYFAGQLIASFIWPPLSDKFGRKKMLLLGQIGLTVPDNTVVPQR